MNDDIKQMMTEFHVNIEDIIIDENLQVRKNDWSDSHTKDALKKSIRGEGLLTPLIVQIIENGNDRKYIIISGHRRFQVLKENGIEWIYCTVKKNLSYCEQYAIIIREDMVHKEYTQDEREKIWTKYYIMRHEQECHQRDGHPCDFSDIKGCGYQVKRWAREMGIPVSIARLHVKHPGNQLLEIDTDEEIEISKREMGIVHGKKHRLEFSVNEEEKKKILKAAKSAGMGTGKYILRKLDLVKCPGCGEKLD